VKWRGVLTGINEEVLIGYKVKKLDEKQQISTLSEQFQN
jgi:hypothetical protein